jgi:hypothetical protein
VFGEHSENERPMRDERNEGVEEVVMLHTTSGLQNIAGY